MKEYGTGESHGRVRWVLALGGAAILVAGVLTKFASGRSPVVDFTHGPQPGAVEAVIRGLEEGRTTTDETAVMIDTFRPLLLAPASRRAEDPEYAWSWAKAARSEDNAG